MWVHFHNETKVRQYTTEDWDELITLIENDIGMDRGVEKITFKASKAAEECEVNPDVFDEIMGSPGKHAHGVFNVYFAVRRQVTLPGDKEPREVFCIDFEHFVQQLEELAGSPVKRITYTAQGPDSKPIEFEVAEDTFTELPNLVFRAYFADGDEETEEEQEPRTSEDNSYTIQVPDLPHPFVLRGDLYWSDFMAALHQLNPKARVDKVIARTDRGKETVVTEDTFDAVDADTATFFVHCKEKKDFPVSVQLSEKLEPSKLSAAHYADLKGQIEELVGRPVQTLTYASPEGPRTLLDAQFEAVVADPTVILKPTFGSGTVSKLKRVFVQMPGERHPLFLSVANLDGLMARLEALIKPQGGEVTGLRRRDEKGHVVDLDGQTFDTLPFPHKPLEAQTNEPNIRLVKLEWEDKPRRIFCRSMDQMMEAIGYLLPEGKSIAELTCIIKGPHGQELVQLVDEAMFLDAAEDPSMVFMVKTTGSSSLHVSFPDDDEVKSYKAKTYGELVKQIESDTALLVSHLTNIVDRSGTKVEVTLVEDTFEEQVFVSPFIRVYFKEIPTLKVLMPDDAEPKSLAVPQFEDLMYQIKKLAGSRDIEKLTYEVKGPKGQKVELELTAAEWEEVAADPQDTIVKVTLGPAPKQYCVEFPDGPKTVNAQDFDSLQRQIRKEAGGRRVSAVLVEQASSSSELTPAALQQLGGSAPQALKVVLAPVAEGSWITASVKFPFEKQPRRIAGCEYEGLVQQINKEAPEGFLELEKLTYYPEGVEVDVDAAQFREVFDSNLTFYAHFVPDPKYPLPARMVILEGTDQKYPVYAATFRDFMEVVEEVAAGRPIVHLGPDIEGFDADQDDMAKVFYDLPRDTSFVLSVAKGSQAAGARVKFPHSLDEVLLEAHTFDRLMHLIKMEALEEGYKVAKVTYFVEGPRGQKMECENLDEEVFENLEDLDHVQFKVYYEGQPKGSKLVLYPEDDRPHQVLAETYEDFVEAIMEENPDKPRIEMILYEIPAPKGGKVSFPLTEDAWDDLADEENVVFKVIFPLPTTEILIQFPWDETPRSVPAGSFEELQESIAKACPGDQKVLKLTYSVEGPSGHKMEFPLDQTAFDDIEDADTLIKVYTAAHRALYVQYPAAPIAWQSDFGAFLKAVQNSAAPGKKVKAVLITPPGGKEGPLDAAQYKALETQDGVTIRVEYE